MLDKMQLWLKEKIGQPYAYYITVVVYLTLVFGGLTIVGFVFNSIFQIIIMAILMSILRFYTMGFHCHTNGKCFIVSSILFIIFGILSKIIPMWAVFLLSLYSCRNIYQKSPIELNSDFNKDIDWHFKRVVFLIVVFLTFSLIAYYFKLFIICKCILLSLVMVDLLLFKNDKEYI